MPRGFKIVSYDFDLLVPMALDPTHEILAGFAYRGIARMRPGVAIEQANQDVARLLNVWMNSWSNGPGTDPKWYLNWKIAPAIEPLKKTVVGSIQTVLWVVMGTIGVVMLIACTNVANLLLVRADARQQELAVRSALGAGRWRMARELLVESVTLGLLGGAVGVSVAYGGLRLLTAIGPGQLPRMSEISLDGWSVGFTLILSVLSGLFFGAIPVLRYLPSRQGMTLLGVRTASVSRERQRGRNVLVVSQVAMALVLLIGAVLMIRTFVAMRNVDPGFAAPASLQVMRLSIPETLVKDATTTVRMQNAILEKLAAIPGVSSVGFAASVPMSGAEPSWDQILVEGKNHEGDNVPMRLYNYVSPGYFHTAGTRIVAGRDFTWTEVYGVRPVGMVSEGLARELWGSPQAAIGKRFKEFEGAPWHEVVGVVQDVHENGVDQVSPATVYWPSLLGDNASAPEKLRAWRTPYFALRSNQAGTQVLINEMQQAVWSVNASLPVTDVSTMQEIYGDSMARTSFTLVMLGIAGAMALGLGILGIYGVIAYAVSQRTREIGIRMALGAKKSELVWMFVRSALVLTGVGTVVGLGAAAGVMRLMRSLLFGISPLDTVTFTAVPVVLLAAAALASYLPARRTTAIDPVDALRAE
jgi:predicted permease